MVLNQRVASFQCNLALSILNRIRQDILHVYECPISLKVVPTTLHIKWYLLSLSRSTAFVKCSRPTRFF